MILHAGMICQAHFSSEPSDQSSPSRDVSWNGSQQHYLLGRMGQGEHPGIGDGRLPTDANGDCALNGIATVCHHPVS